MRLLALGFVLVAALAACGRSANAGVDNAGLGAITAISMEKTPCYGTCPAYIVRFTADGRARYTGLHDAPLKGSFSAKFDFASLAAWIATQHPETLENTYRTAATDAPAVNLRIDYGARRVTIAGVQESTVPWRLEGILLAIDGATSRIRWHRDDASTVFLGDFSGNGVTLDVDQDSTGRFFAYMMRGERCSDSGGYRVAADRGTLRLRCGTRASVVRIAGDGVQAEGDAIPSGRYHRISLYAAAADAGYRPEPRAKE